MTRQAERTAVRLGVPALLVGSCVGATFVSMHARRSEIPSFAFGSHVVLAVQEIADQMLERIIALEKEVGNRPSPH